MRFPPTIQEQATRCQPERRDLATRDGDGSTYPTESDQTFRHWRWLGIFDGLMTGIGTRLELNQKEEAAAQNIPYVLTSQRINSLDGDTDRAIVARLDHDHRLPRVARKVDIADRWLGFVGWA